MVSTRRSPASAVFQDAETIYQADSCVALKRAAAQGLLRLVGFGRRGYPGKRLPQGVLDDVASLGFWDAPAHQSWGLDWHRNEGIELTYLARGRLHFAVDGEEHRLAAGDLTVTRPWQKHRVGNPHIHASRLIWVILDLRVRRPDQPWQWPAWLTFTAGDRQRLTDLMRHCERPVWRADRALGMEFERLALQLESADARRDETLFRITLNSLLLNLLGMLKSRRIALEPALASTRRVVQLFLQSLPEHLDHPWTLDRMAEHCGLGRSRFAHYCREITNMSPTRYLMRCRLDEAARRLQHSPDVTITEVALACGFNSSQYFSNAYRREFGSCPLASLRTRSRKNSPGPG